MQTLTAMPVHWCPEFFVTTSVLTAVTLPTRRERNRTARVEPRCTRTLASASRQRDGSGKKRKRSRVPRGAAGIRLWPPSPRPVRGCELGSALARARLPLAPKRSRPARPDRRPRPDTRRRIEPVPAGEVRTSIDRRDPRRLRETGRRNDARCRELGVLPASTAGHDQWKGSIAV